MAWSVKAYSSPVRIVAIPSVMMNELPPKTGTSRPLAIPTPSAIEEHEDDRELPADAVVDHQRDRGAGGEADHRADREVEVAHHEHDRQPERDDHPGSGVDEDRLRVVDRRERVRAGQVVKKRSISAERERTP